MAFLAAGNHFCSVSVEVTGDQKSRTLSALQLRVRGSVFLSTLGFRALLSLVRTGRLEQEKPKLLYGALAQQLLSLVLAGKSSYQRVADLTQIFSTLPHVDRATIETILNHLGGHRYLVRHGFQNRYGAGDPIAPVGGSSPGVGELPIP